MMGQEYTKAAGYQIDGETLCVPCGDARKLPVSDQFTEAQAISDFGGEGLYCDHCSALIVDGPEEFDEEYEYEFDDDEYADGGDLETD